jgi:hypothetical protein
MDGSMLAVGAVLPVTVRFKKRIESGKKKRLRTQAVSAV